MKSNAFFVITFILCIIFSCSKPTDMNRTLNQPLLDSIIFGSANLHYIYDAQNRIIKERFADYDTLREENVYSYNGNDSLPYSRNHNAQFTVNDYVSFFEYENGKKTHDSSYYFSSGNSIVSDINYSVAGKICVLQKTSLNWLSDTIYLGTDDNIDSIRHFTNMVQPHGSLMYFATTKFLQYNTIPNALQSLSIGKCNFYTPEPVENYGSHLKRYSHHYSILGLDFFNANYYTSASMFSIAAGGMISNISRQIQFNNTNQPVSEVLTVNGFDYPQTRFIYR